jgi:hypothetical protein
MTEPRRQRLLSLPSKSNLQKSHLYPIKQEEKESINPHLKNERRKIILPLPSISHLYPIKQEENESINPHLKNERRKILFPLPPRSRLSPIIQEDKSKFRLSPIIQEDEDEDEDEYSLSPIKEDKLYITTKPHLNLDYNDDFYILAHIYNLFKIYKDDNIDLPHGIESRKNLLDGLNRLYECLFIKECHDPFFLEILNLNHDNITILHCGHFCYKKSLNNLESYNRYNIKNIICPECRTPYNTYNKFTISLNDIPGIKQPQQKYYIQNINYNQYMISILLQKIIILQVYYKKDVIVPPYFIKSSLLNTLQQIYNIFKNIKIFDYRIHNEIIILNCGHFFYFNIIRNNFNKQICPKCNNTFKNYITIKLIDIESSAKMYGGENIKIKKYIKYLDKFDLKKIYNIATNKKIKFTLKTSKKQIINKLVKFKFS